MLSAHSKTRREITHSNHHNDKGRVSTGFAKRRLCNNRLISQKGTLAVVWAILDRSQADLQTMDIALWQGRRAISHGRDGYNFMISCSVKIFISLWYIVRPKRRPWLESLRCQAFVLRLQIHISIYAFECCFFIPWFVDLMISWFRDLIPAVGRRPAWMSMTTLSVPVFMHTTTFFILPTFQVSRTSENPPEKKISEESIPGIILPPIPRAPIFWFH